LEEITVKLKPALTLVALACVGASASAANVTDWGALGPVPAVAYITYHTPGPVDDIYTFTLSAPTDVDAYGKEFEARSVTMTGSTFTLFSGSYGSPGATQVGSPFAFSDVANETVFSALPTGSYYFEVMGTGALQGSAYDFEAFASTGTPPLTVPEPASAALLMAGVGVMTFLSRRRRRQ
jgi:hypothetical protein